MKKDISGKISTHGILLTVLSIVLILSLVACGNTVANDDNISEHNEDNQSPPIEAAEETPDSSEVSESALEPTDIINLEALKAIENKDESEVKVTKKEFIKNAYTGISLEGNDACMLTITNSSSKDIAEVTIYAVAYADNNALMKLSQGSYSIGGEPYIQAFTTQDIVIVGGESESVGIKCRADKIAGVRVIVASYKTTDGTIYENSLAEEWYKNVKSGEITTLD